MKLPATLLIMLAVLVGVAIGAGATSLSRRTPEGENPAAASVCTSTSQNAFASEVAGESLITLCFQDAAKAPDESFYIHFVGYKDQRCASDGMCAWEGEASTIFQVSSFNAPYELVSVPWDASNREWNSPLRVGRHEIELRSLRPDPPDSDTVSPMRYQAVVAVRTVSEQK